MTVSYYYFAYQLNYLLNTVGTEFISTSNWIQRDGKSVIQKEWNKNDSKATNLSESCMLLTLIHSYNTIFN